MDFKLLLILCFAVILVIFILLTLSDKKPKNDTPMTANDIKGKAIEKATQVTTGSKKKDKKVELVNLKKFIEFDKILDDMIVQNGGNKFTMILQCKGINYDLMSEIEQINVEKAFIEYISRIDYPIQIFVQSRTIDLKENIQNFKQRIIEYDLKCQEAELEYQKLMQSMDIDTNKITSAQLKMQRANNIYQYVSDITNYIEKTSYDKQMLQRKFYIIFSVEKDKLQNVTKLKAKEVPGYAYGVLFKRACGAVEDLAKAQVIASILSSRHLSELLYDNLYADEDKKNEFMQSVDLGFYSVYSSTRANLMQRNQSLYQEYQQERKLQDERKKAFEREKGIIKKEVNEEYDREEKIDKMAVKIIANADIDFETKDALTKLIVKKHIENATAKGFQIDTTIENNKVEKLSNKILDVTDNNAALQ